MFEVVGQIALFGVLGLLCALLGAVLNVRFLAVRWNPCLRPSIWLIDVFHLQVKMVVSALFGASAAYDARMVGARNLVNEKHFAMSGKRVFLAPHCLRDSRCPANSTQYGIQCVRCGKCKLGVIRQWCEEKGYPIFILAGSSFVKKLLQEKAPEGVYLLGCPYEINKVMMHLRGLAARGVLLSRDGCVATDVDLSAVAEALGVADLEHAAELTTDAPGGAIKREYGTPVDAEG